MTTATFTPSNEWQHFPIGAASPPGCQFHVDMGPNGQECRWARWDRGQGPGPAGTGVEPWLPIDAGGNGHDAATVTAGAIPTTIRDVCALLFEPGRVAELRIPNTRQATVSGYFDTWAELEKTALRYDGQAPGVYVTLNPLNPDLLARAVNRVKSCVKTATADADVVKRVWLPMDFDAARPADISSTDVEHQAALDRAALARTWLMGLGWPEPIYADSGNGAHLLSRVDLPNDADSLKLVENCLAALAFQFSDSVVKVDVTTGNAARIWKLYGSLCCKGDSTPNRPHRRAGVLSLPGKIETVTGAQLAALAALVPSSDSPTGGAARSITGQFNLEAWIAAHGLPVVSTGPWKDGRKWIINPCPWDSAHNNRAAYIVQLGNGAIGAGCKHNGCAGRGWPELRELYEPGYRDRQTPTSSPASSSPTAATVKTRRRRWTDLGNAERLADRHGDKLRYVREWGWMVWDGARWARDPGLAMRLAKECARSIYHETGDADDEERRKALAKWAAASESAAKLAAMLSLAESEPGIAVKADLFDTDPMLLNCQNGTVDLRTGQLREHRQTDYITTVVPVPYDPAATCPTFDAFLQTIMGNVADLIAFLQRAFGYSLTGKTVERVLFILHGCGRNGKTTLLKTILGLLGDYALRTPTETLLVKRGDSIPNDVARLRGARYVCCSENEDGRRLAESLVKDLTGGDTLAARFMRGEWFDFTPACKVWLGTNHKPTIKGTDKAIWDRIRLIPFNVRIADDAVDKDLPDKLKAEWPGILKWAVDGCLAWQRAGLGAPAEVEQATAAYQAEMDVLAAFLGDCCTTALLPSGIPPTATAKALYATYKAWCEQSGEKPVKQIAFGQALAERGFQRGRDKTGQREWEGLALLSTTSPPSSDPKTGDLTHSPDLTHFDTNSSIAISKNSLPGGIGKTVSKCVNASNSDDDAERF